MWLFDYMCVCGKKYAMWRSKMQCDLLGPQRSGESARRKDMSSVEPRPWFGRCDAMHDLGFGGPSGI
jgi:hypothetical protein